MKNSVRLAVLVGGLISLGAHARVIYGEDNRMEVSEATPFMQKLAKSTATMVSETKMTRDAGKPGLVTLEQTTLKEWIESAGEEKFLTQKGLESHAGALSFCSSERFVEQPNAGMCSGFLIAPDLIVTAGHCVVLNNFCSEYSWVFDFQVDPETKKAGVDIKEENIYKCKQVVSSALDMQLGLDYAVVQLDRRVDREPLEIANDKKIENFTNLVLIGSPSGLPLKVAPGATVRNNAHPFYFSTNTDSYQGNSGSAVFNAQSGVVEGILVRGEEDFALNRLLMCVESKRCPKEGCRGEDVSRLTSIPEVGIQVALNKAAETGDIETLNNIFKLNTWVDFYSKDGQTALMKAILNKQMKAMELLIARGANINHQDTDGNSVLHHMASRLNQDQMGLVDTLVKTSMNLDLQNNLGEAAIHLAASENNIGGVRILMRAGAIKNIVNKKGETVLFAFVRHGNTKAVDQLLREGVDINLKNAEGKSALEIEDANPHVIAQIKKMMDLMAKR